MKSQIVQISASNYENHRKQQCIRYTARLACGHDKVVTSSFSVGRVTRCETCRMESRTSRQPRPHIIWADPNPQRQIRVSPLKKARLALQKALNALELGDTEQTLSILRESLGVVPHGISQSNNAPLYGDFAIPEGGI